MTNLKVDSMWLAIAMQLGRVYGTPLPKQRLLLGEEDAGWRVEFNNMPGSADEYRITINWNGLPAGVLDHQGGVISAGPAANLATFKDWLVTADKPSTRSQV